MQNMKKHFSTRTSTRLIAFALCAVLLMTASVPAFAATLDQNTPSGETKVVYKAGQTTDNKGTDDPSDDTVSGTYTVTIPEYIEAAAVGSEPTAQNVVAKDVLIPYATSLKVTVDFDNTLKLTDNTATGVAYDFKVSGSKTASGGDVMTVAAGDPNTTTTVAVSAILTQAPIYSGVYTDTATFHVAVA